MLIQRRTVRLVVPTEEWLRGSLRGAILAVCSNDQVLLHRDASERSLMFRLGRYLAPAVEDRWPGLWVDLEYNRLAGEGRTPKAVTGLDSSPNGQTDGAPAERRALVLPDLIIHDRRGRSGAHNVLVVEAKKHPATLTGVTFDLRKLCAYKQELNYQHAVYVEFSTDGPRWQWIDSDEAPVSITPFT